MRFARRGAVLRQIDHLFRVGSMAGLTDAEFLRRFADGRDEAAFAALVERHGPMVLAVCQGVLRSRHDAEDASQATFLILARKARTLVVGESLGGWLHRVAHRVAVQAAVERTRRQAREQRAAVAERQEGREPGGRWDELLGMLHEEIGRLPEKYRSPIVLCDLEAMTRDQAAGQLGWPPGTVAGRLARGRDLLKDRLARRGMLLAGGIASGLLAAREAAASAASALSRAYIEQTAGAAARVAAAGKVSAGAVPAGVITLAEGVDRMMALAQIRRALAALTTGVVLTGLIAAALAWAPQGDDDTGMVVTGIVLGDDGRPAAGVDVFGSLRDGGSGYGKVFATARTDDSGRFHLDVPAHAAGAPDSRGWGLWAYRPGSVVASLEVGRGTVFPDVPVRLALGPAARAEFQVRAPDGTPVAGARIRPRVLNRGFLAVPDGLAERLEAGVVTDARGRAVLSALFPEEVSTVSVTAEGYGTQQFGFGFREAGVGTKVIDLLPVGRVRGRVVGDPTAVGGLRLAVMTSSRTHPSPYPGAYDVTTDDRGRFEVPEIAAGNLGINSPRLDPQSRHHVTLPPGKTVEPGRTTEVEVPLAASVRVHGVVRERPGGNPIAGADVALSLVGRPIRTGADGRYEGYVAQRTVNPRVVATPRGYAGPVYRGPASNVPEGAAEFELPPIELVRAGDVRGLVVDERGRPVAGARVEASWGVNEGARRTGRTGRKVGTDGHGEFRVEGVPLDAAVALTARHRDALTADSVPARAGEGPARLRLEAGRALALEGRIVEGDGRPVAGARVHFRVQTRHPTGQPDREDSVAFDEARVVTTDAAGRYRTPRELDPAREYAAFAEADGFASGKSSWVLGSSGRFPELVLARVEAPKAAAELSGRVANRLGAAVAGARIRTSAGPAVAATDASGRFRIRLDGSTAGRSLLFVEARGFRMHGQVVERPGGPVEVVLTGEREAPRRPIATLPPPLTLKEDRELARRTLEPFVDRVLKQGSEFDQNRALALLAAVDPARVLDLVATRTWRSERTADHLRAAVASRLMRDDPDEGLTVIESIGDLLLRAQLFMRASAVLPPAARAEKLRRLDRALIAARGITDPVWRVPMLGSIAEHWLDLGETERATTLLRETVPVAMELPTQARGGFARGSFAPELAQVDPDAALRLIAPVPTAGQVVPDRHLVNIVQELAGRDPARAEELLGRLEQPTALGINLSRIVHAMAPKDLPRARRLVDRAGALKDEHDEFPFARPHALAMMALALADSDRPAAAGLIGEALAELRRLAPEARRDFVGMQDAASVAAALLPVVERVDPERLPESFWLAASLREASPSNARPERVPPDVVLALFLARYDRSVAAVLLEPALDRGLTESRARGNRDPILWAAAAVDPRRAYALVDAMPEEPDATLNLFKNPKNLSRLALAGILVTPADEWWDAATRKVLHLWTPGLEDLQ